MINLHEYRFEVYILVSEIHDTVDKVIGIKKVYEIGVISTRGSCLHFLNRFIPLIPKTEILLIFKMQRFIKIDVP